MSEQREQHTDSPLVNERGDTQISQTVVSRVVGLAAREVEGVYMGGEASRRASGVVSRASDTQDETRGVSVQVGKVETAVDLKLALEYGVSLPEVVEALRSRIRSRVENMTGLRVSELNITVDDFVFPENKETKAYLEPSSEETREIETGPIHRGDRETPAATREERTDREEAPAGHEGTRTGREGTQTDREEVRVEERPLRRGEAADLDAADEDVEIRPIGEESRRESRGGSRGGSREGSSRGSRRDSETAHGSTPEGSASRETEDEEERRG